MRVCVCVCVSRAVVGFSRLAGRCSLSVARGRRQQRQADSRPRSTKRARDRTPARHIANLAVHSRAVTSNFWRFVCAPRASRQREARRRRPRVALCKSAQSPGRAGRRDSDRSVARKSTTRLSALRELGGERNERRKSKANKQRPLSLTSRDRQRRTPLLFQNVETDRAVAIDVRVVDFRCKIDLRARVNRAVTRTPRALSPLAA